MANDKNKKREPEALRDRPQCASTRDVLWADARLEEALEESFPASDPAATNRFDR